MADVPVRDPVLVVGAGAAGLTTVEALRREGHAGPIVLLGDESHPPYDRPPLSKDVLRGGVDRSRLLIRSPEALEALDVDLLPGRAARRLDVGDRRVLLDDGAELGYHRLVIATGVRPALPAGLVGAPGVLTLRTLDDALRIAAAMRGATSMLVIGGGLLGYELAAAGRCAGLGVTVVDGRPRPLEGILGPVAGPLLAGVHREHGVDILSGRRVLGACPSGNGTRVALDDGTTLAADLVIAAIGSRPNVEWLTGSGLDLADGVGCDRGGRAAPGVFAAGNVARWRGGGGRVEHRTNATEQALAVARRIVHRAAPRPHVPYFWTDQYRVRLQVAGAVPADADTAVVAGDPATRRFVVTARRDGELVGVLGWGMPKDFARHRAGLAAAR